MAKYYENMGTCVPDNLVASGDINPVTASGTIKSGSGVLVRGTVLALSSGTAGTGKLSVLGTAAATNETLTAYGILCDDVDATSADAVAEVYLTGRFNKNELKVSKGYEITADDIKALRDGGIFLENSVK